MSDFPGGMVAPGLPKFCPENVAYVQESNYPSEKRRERVRQQLIVDRDWTVVGFTDDRFQNRVEYVVASSAEEAAARACEQMATLQVVAVFAGRLRDKLAAENADRWPLKGEVE